LVKGLAEKVRSGIEMASSTRETPASHHETRIHSALYPSMRREEVRVSTAPSLDPFQYTADPDPADIEVTGELGVA
jgi:hypothetical protein